MKIVSIQMPKGYLVQVTEEMGDTAVQKIVYVLFNWKRAPETDACWADWPEIRIAVKVWTDQYQEQMRLDDYLGKMFGCVVTTIDASQ